MSGVEWKGRVDFAEFAEVLDTTTEYIFAASPQSDGRWHVIYTPHYGEGDHTMWTAWLRRDSDDILRLDTVPEAQPGMWERMQEQIEKKVDEMAEELGGDNAE